MQIDESLRQRGTSAADDTDRASARGSYARSFADVPREHGFEPLRVEGTLPRELSGTLYRNGPGLFSSFGHRYEHWFDGDGLVCAVRFADGRAEGAARVVESAGLSEERRLGRAYYGSYGTKAPGRWNPWRALRFAREGGKNPANTSVLCWDDRVFALCEVGRPTEIHPDTLATIGETDLGGAVVRPFSAHPHRVDETGYVFNVGARLGRPNALDVIALRPDGSAGRVAEIPLAFPTMIHDFAVTSKHVVIFVAPLEIGLFRILFGRASFAGAMDWKAERGTEVIVIPLDAPASPIRFSTDAFWAWHVANAFEEGGEIVVDVVRYRDFRDSARWLAGVTEGLPAGEPDGRLARARIDARRGHLAWEPLRERTGEFPRVAPSVEARRYRQLYLAEHSTGEAARRGPPDTLVRVDLERGAIDEHRFAAHEWPSEGVFVPRPGATDETDGWIVSLVYDADRHASAWTVLDARRVSDGPVARAWLDHHVPLGFHGAWRPSR